MTCSEYMTNLRTFYRSHDQWKVVHSSDFEVQSLIFSYIIQLPIVILVY